jgi:hypothetical protein
MIRSIIVIAVLFSTSFIFSTYYVGYPGAGKQYIKKHREKRKSLRYGSTYYGGRYYGSGGFRGGK